VQQLQGQRMGGHVCVQLQRPHLPRLVVRYRVLTRVSVTADLTFPEHALVKAGGGAGDEVVVASGQLRDHRRGEQHLQHSQWQP
jgi:hypothetical protein